MDIINLCSMFSISLLQFLLILLICRCRLIEPTQVLLMTSLQASMSHHRRSGRRRLSEPPGIALTLAF